MYYGRVTSFRREQGFGVITLEDGRAVKFDASNCKMVPEEGAPVQLRIAPAKWGGGFKALHVEPGGAVAAFAAAAPPSIDQLIAALQREHLVGALSEHVMAQLVTKVFGGRLGDATVVDVIDAFYAADPASARHDGYLRFVHPRDSAADAVEDITALLPGIALPQALEQGDVEAVVALANQALAATSDPRTLHPLRTTAGRHAYFLLTAAQRDQLAGTLPFAH